MFVRVEGNGALFFPLLTDLLFLFSARNIPDGCVTVSLPVPLNREHGSGSLRVQVHLYSEKDHGSILSAEAFGVDSNSSHSQTQRFMYREEQGNTLP